MSCQESLKIQYIRFLILQKKSLISSTSVLSFLFVILSFKIKHFLIDFVIFLLICTLHHLHIYHFHIFYDDLYCFENILYFFLIFARFTLISIFLIIFPKVKLCNIFLIITFITGFCFHLFILPFLQIKKLKKTEIYFKELIPYK